MWSKIFSHSQMTETSVLCRLYAYCHDTCTLSSVCYVKVDPRYGNIHLRNAKESEFGLLTFRGYQIVSSMVTTSKMTMVGKRGETSKYMQFVRSVSKTGQITEKMLNETHTHTHTHTHTQEENNTASLIC